MVTEKQFGELDWPDAHRRRVRPWERWANRAFHRLGLPIQLRRPFDYRRDMVDLEQVGNLQLLLTAVLDHRVPGRVVELGAHTGATAAVLAQVLGEGRAEHPFHVYDTFAWAPNGGARSAFEANFARLGLELPRLHVGDVRRTLPGELPDRIAFAHIDLGMGNDPAAHHALVLHALQAVYGRTSPGGVIALMDYHRPGTTVDGCDANPGMRLAADAFFADKPEQVRTLYGGACSHAYIRKQG